MDQAEGPRPGSGTTNPQTPQLEVGLPARPVMVASPRQTLRPPQLRPGNYRRAPRRPPRGRLRHRPAAPGCPLATAGTERARAPGAGGPPDCAVDVAGTARTRCSPPEPAARPVRSRVN